METLKSTLKLCLLSCCFFLVDNAGLLAQDAGNYPTNHDLKLVEGRKRQLFLLPPVTNTIEVSDLVIGAQYLLTFNKDDVNKSCQPSFRLINGSVDTSFMETRLDFVAKAKKVTINVVPACKADYNSRLAMYITVAKRSDDFIDVVKQTTKNTKGGSPEGPLVGSSGSTALSLIQDVFIGGGCFDVSNVQQIGAASQIGEFEGGGSSIQIESGVLITSGNCSIASGPNNAEGAGAGVGGGSDPDLLSLANGGSIFDAGGIQFDFKPTISMVQFNYVFGSEEYEEYTCSNFNDVFGFFIDGPALNKNIALIPSTNLPVKINFVNQGSPGAFGNIANCTPPFGSLAYSGFYVSNPVGSPDVQYDGFTTVFTAQSAVIPCSSYHIKLVVGDAGDGVFDSGVFLEANSFAAGGSANGMVVVPSSGTNIIYEGCTDGYIHFVRYNQSGLDQDLVITFIVDPSSTATSGVDYATLPTSITIPAGEEEFDLPITVFADLLIEGTETIRIKLSTPCSCESPFIEILIKDPPPVLLTAEDVTVCESEGGADISVTASGGIGSYSYAWSPGGGTDESVYVITSVTQTYTVTVTDECGHSATKSVTVYVIKDPYAKIEGEGKICFGQSGSVNLKVTFEGQGPWTLIYSVNGFPQTPITNITTNPYTLVGTLPGYYNIEQVYGFFDCSGGGEGEGYIEEVKVEMFSDVQNPNCSGANNGEISIDPYGGEEDYYIKWSNGVEGFDYIDYLAPGTYTVTVTDNMGCKTTNTFVLVDPPKIAVTATIKDVLDCLNANGGEIDITVSGGIAPYTYKWESGSTDEDQTGLAPGLYTVTVSDLYNCEKVYSYNVNSSNGPSSNAVTLKNVDCKNLKAGSIDVTVNGGSKPYNYAWSDGSTVTEDLTGAGPGTYVVTITDAGGCKTVSSATITADTLKPTVNAGVDKLLTCIILDVTLEGGPSPLPNGFTSQWTTIGGTIISGDKTLSPKVGAPGTYILTITNPQNGCASVDEVVVNPDANKPIVFMPDPDILTCDIIQLTLDGTSSTSGTKYVTTWTTIGGNIINSGPYTADIDKPGKYTLTVKDTTNGCETEYTVNVSQDIVKPLAQAGNKVTLTCKDLQLKLDGNGTSVGAKYSYDWTTQSGFIVTGKTGLSPTINMPGWYYLQVENTLTGCKSFDSVLVDEDKVPPLAAAIAPTVLTCNVGTVPVNATGSSTGSNYVYNWSTINGNISGPNTGFTINATIAGQYTVTVTNSLNGCTEIASAIVGEDKELPVANAGVSLEKACKDLTKTLDGNGSSQGPKFTYQWSTIGGNILSGDKSLTPIVDEPGIYQLIVTNTLNGCTAVDTMLVKPSVDAPVIVLANPELITCTVAAIFINGSASSSGSIFTYDWTTQNGHIVSGSNGNAPYVDKAGTYTFVVTNTDNGCTAKKSIDVTEDKIAPKANAGGDFEAGCFNKPVPLDGTKSNGKGNLTFNWTTSDGEIESGEASSTPAIIQAGTYALLVTDESNGCTSVDQVTVTSNALKAVEVGLQIPSCFGEFGTAQVTNVEGGVAPYSYSINGGQTYSGNTIFNKLEPGLYTILVKDGYDCVIGEKFEIPAKTDMKVLLEPKINIYLGETIKLKAQVNIPKDFIKKVEWFSKEGLSRSDTLVTIADILQTTEYTVRVTDLNNCTAQAKVLVVVADPEIYVPNAFSPHNLDGYNDNLMVFARSEGIKQITTFQIYNRWGEKMYEANHFQPNDPNFGWNGKSRGKEMDPAVFVWWLEAEYINGKKKIYKGDASLVR